MFMTKTVLSNLMSKYSTRLHPVEQRVLPEMYRGRFEFIPEKCILCKICSIKCPTKVITVDTETGVWTQDVKGCVYCGVCEDVCPTKCLHLTNVYHEPFTETRPMLSFTAPPRPKKVKAEAAPAKDAAAGVKEAAPEPAKAAPAQEAKAAEEAPKPKAEEQSKAKAKGKKR